MTRSLFLLMAGTGLAAILGSGSAQAEELRDAVAAALTQHPSIEAARASETYSNEESREHQSDLFPEFSATATGGRMFGDNSTSRGLTSSRGQAYSWLWEGNATLTQPIFDGLETFNRIDAAQARQSSASYKVADAREELALRAVQAYITVLQATEAVEKITAYKAKIDDYRSRIQEMVDQGVSDEAEVAQAKNVSLLLENTLAETKSQLDTAFAAYKEAVGKMPESTLTRPDSPAAMILPSAEDALSHAKAHHPMLLAAYKDMEAAGYDVDAERGTLMPSLDGELSYLKRDQKEEIGGEVEDGRALLRMSWDFSTGGGDLARIRKTKAAYSEKLARSQETLLQIERGIRISYADLQRAEKQKELTSERARIMKDLFDANETQFEGARLRLLQVMQSDNQLFGATLEQMNADYSLLLSQYAVLASTGRLQMALGLGDDMGDPVASASVPVVAAPKAMDVKVEPDPQPAIEEIDDRSIHEGLIKEKPKSVKKKAPEKAEVIEPAEKEDTATLEQRKPVFDQVLEEATGQPVEADVPVINAPADTAPVIQDERVFPDMDE